MLTIDTILEKLNEEDRAVMNALRSVILSHLPVGFEEQVSYGMIGYVIPHSLYPKGYHVDPTLPLPFMGIARQKNAYSFYHMGLYGDLALFEWFKSDYQKNYGKLDHGKSCLRFKTKEKIPFELLGILVSKISVNDFIQSYEASLSKNRR